MTRIGWSRGRPGPTAIVLALFVLLEAGRAVGSPPEPPVRACAEWEPVSGTLVRWPLGIPASLVVELAREDSLYVLVESAEEETAARSAFVSWNVELGHCRFIPAPTYSRWTRDWGPHWVFTADGWGIVDPTFQGYPWVRGCLGGGIENLPDTERGGSLGWEDDDAVNPALAADFGCPLFAFPGFLTGGNLMVDGYGTAFSTVQMLDENSGQWTETEFRDVARTYLGIRDYHFLLKPDAFGIQHIDCWAKLLDPETILVKELPSWHEEHDCAEALASQVEELTNPFGRPYRIVRIYCPPYEESRAAAYTNSLILNGKVLVPLFGIPSDERAIETYREAMPGYRVIGFESGAWCDYDALHCRVTGIFDRQMLRLEHRPLDAEMPEAPGFDIGVRIEDWSRAGLVAESLRVFWRPADEDEWRSAPLVESAVPDSFVAGIPRQSPGTAVEYYLSAASRSGRTATLPFVAPAGVFEFTVVPSLSEVPPEPEIDLSDLLTLGPNPFRDLIAIRLAPPNPVPTTLEVFDIQGRRVKTLAEGQVYAAPTILWWDGADDYGEPCAPGVYLVTLRSSLLTVSARCVLVR